MSLTGQPIDQYEFYPDQHTKISRQPSWMNEIWEEGVSFEDTAMYKHWYDATHLAGPLTDRYQRSSMIYQLDTNDVHVYIPDPHTGKVYYCQGIPGKYYSPLPGAMCFLYDGIAHYDRLSAAHKFKSNEPVELRFLCAGHEVEYSTQSFDIASGPDARQVKSSNIISVPRGKQHCITLSDGVHLNVSHMARRIENTTQSGT